MQADADDAFLEAICADLWDDTPRLIYADFLEESGNPVRVARAEFIRLQCELANLPESDARPPDLQQREAALLRIHRRAWNGPVHRRLQAGPLRGQMRARRGLIRSWHYRRGFIADVTAFSTAILRHPQELLALGPVECLRVRAAQEALVDLLTAPILAQVNELDLSSNQLTDGSVPLLLAAPQVARLRLLDLRHNFFGLPARAQLETAIRTGQLPAQTLLDASTGSEISRRPWNRLRARAWGLPAEIRSAVPPAPSVPSPSPTPQQAAPAGDPSPPPQNPLVQWLRRLWQRGG